MIARIKSFLFKNQTPRQTVTKNVFWLGFGQIGGRLIRGLFIIFAARVLGASEFGVFSYALGLAGFFTLFVDIGISPILKKDASRKPEKASSYFATSFWIKIFLLFITTLLVVFIAPHFSKIEAAKILLYFVALLTIFDTLREFFNAFFHAQEKMELEALVNILMNIAIAVIGAIVLYFSQTARAITIAYVSSAGIGFLVAGFIIRRELKKIISAFDKKLIKPTIQTALPIVVLGFLGVFMLNTDVVIIGWFRSAAEIGFYSVGQRVVQLLYLIPGILAAAIFPTLSRASGNKENQKVSFIMEKGMAIVFAFALPMTAGGIILAKPIINFLFGQGYLPAILTFQILLLTNIVIFPQMLLSNFVLAYNKQKQIAKYVALTALGNVIFDFLLIPKFGIAGSAAGTFIVQAMYIFLTWNMVKKINPFRTLVNLKKISIATVFLGIIAFVFYKINLPILISIALSAGFYFAILIILKEPIIKEIKYIKNEV